MRELWINFLMHIASAAFSEKYSFFQNVEIMSKNYQLHSKYGAIAKPQVSV